MFHWYYVWSPKYEIFHRSLYNSLKDISGIVIHPIFFDQSYFSKTYSKLNHFFQGISIKQEVLVNALKTHIGDHIIFSDVDIIVKDSTLVDYLEKYKNNDMTFMQECNDPTEYNIGFSMIKSTDQNIVFYENVINCIHNEDRLDQDIIRRELLNYSGLVECFSVPDIINLNSLTHENDMQSRIVQLIVESSSNESNVMTQKLLSLGLFVDIRKLYSDLLIECKNIYSDDKVCKYCNGINGCIIWKWTEGDNFNILCIISNNVIDRIDLNRVNNNLRDK
jgi:hypothetical protein